MSQQKVESYKQSKLDRKNEVKKEKLQRNIVIVVAVVILLAVLGWAGYSIYSKAANTSKAETVDVNLDAIDDYANSLAE